MSNEELDSQLSAMFDDELPTPECELLARRLARDEQLRARWGRYAAIGACIRGEHGVQLETALAGRVSAAIKQEGATSAAPASGSGRKRAFGPWVTSLAGLASAAAVATVAILSIRTQTPTAVVQTAAVHPLVVASADPVPRAPVTGLRPSPSREPDSYIVPAAVSQGPVMVPPTELANYIVAHSAYSGPLMRRNALSALVGADSAAPQITAQPIAVTVATGK